MRRNRKPPLNVIISRAAAVLRALKDSSAGLEPADIAERANIPVETAHQLLIILESNGLVSSTASARLQLGPAFMRLAASMGLTLVEVVNPIIVRLSYELRETVD